MLKIMSTRSTEKIVSDALAADDGYCNPLKVKFAAEARQDAIYELEARGYSRAEVSQMFADAEKQSD